MADSRYEFTDNQGRSFNIYASDWEEAWSIAQRTCAERDATARQESYQRAENLRQRVDSRTDEEIRSWRDFSAHKEPRDNSPHIPFEERDNNGRMGIDAAAAMQGNGAGEQMQPLQYGKKMTADQLREYYRKHPELLTTPARQESKQDGGGACLIAVLCVVLVVLFVYMLTV